MQRLTVGVARALRGSFAELSVQKFSSNVIEKCLNSKSTEVRRPLAAAASPWRTPSPLTAALRPGRHTASASPWGGTALAPSDRRACVR